ncbi:hypothetical protein H7J08_23340 [Mycobacterium frederiksbergense]|uniref:hypothetical protein n=1 Tax=Mycolicibacterium frederiksbergense TaxID=117567 RepID=UPI0021F2F426|nr:hypothetical protein [Mycolicibacterium frederiksbergense]MCV7047568.1 hypothetical protein [Mycolicibacterium frederiksbergense]
MTEQRQFAPANVGESIFDGIAAIAKWLALVAAIAVGTCLGIILFLMVAREYASDKLDQLDFRQLSPPPSSSQSGVGSSFS